MLGDVDRQQSARQWLALRPPDLPTISGWDLAHEAVVRPPKGTTHVVLDTPAGLHGKKLDDVMKIADRVIVLQHGRIVEELASPKRSYIAALVREHRAIHSGTMCAECCDVLAA